MSAYIVDTFHISSLVHAAIMYNRRYSRIKLGDLLAGDHNATEIGYALLEANIRSVQTLYPRDTFDTLPGPAVKTAPDDYQYKHSPYYPTQALTILKAIDCYEYQSCEVEGFYESPAGKFCQSLRMAAIHALPGYDEAPGWSLTAPDIDAIRNRIRQQLNQEAQ